MTTIETSTALSAICFDGADTAGFVAFAFSFASGGGCEAEAELNSDFTGGLPVRRRSPCPEVITTIKSSNEVQTTGWPYMEPPSRDVGRSQAPLVTGV
jgi:hypothetical protein